MKVVIAAGKYAGTYTARAVLRCPECVQDMPHSRTGTAGPWCCDTCGHPTERPV